MNHLSLSRAVWRTSARSQQNGACVEVAELVDVVAVRDSRDREGPHLLFPDAAWRVFSQRVKQGLYDL
ncbi:DUF397 domain-containing protein [Actinomadura hibisca]|uniref:DUF397 domain-containing protein n=1 Tax=Actinomadura hibisca TaxID=68565 RepID=UPI0009FDDD18|nr:DUF397 domain-containing protein [Actinomadura hibisca]